MMYSVLYEIAKRQINMTKIESRPTGETLGRYIFLIDIEGHREDAIVKDALSEIRSQVSMFRIFGSYPNHAANGIAASSRLETTPRRSPTSPPGRPGPRAAASRRA